MFFKILRSCDVAPDVIRDPRNNIRVLEEKYSSLHCPHIMRDLELMEMPPLNPVQDGDYWCQEIMVLNKHGLHARPSAKIFEKVLMPLGEELELHFVVDEQGQVPIKSVFDLMSLGLEQGTTVNLKLRLNDETENNPERSAQLLADIRELFLSFCDD